MCAILASRADDCMHNKGYEREKENEKFVGIIVATVLAFSLVGCGPVDSAIQNIASSGSNTSSKSGVVTADDDGYAEGRMGDVMRTYFFDYTVNSAYTCNDYEGYTLPREISC